MSKIDINSSVRKSFGLVVGGRYYTYRQYMMQTRQEGLTKTYNRFHNPDETAADVQHLRLLHVEMDNAVPVAYGWTDLK